MTEQFPGYYSKYFDEKNKKKGKKRQTELQIIDTSITPHKRFDIEYRAKLWILSQHNTVIRGLKDTLFMYKIQYEAKVLESKLKSESLILSNQKTRNSFTEDIKW